MNNILTPNLLKKFRNEYNKDYIHSLLENGISENTIESLFLERDIMQKYNYIFSNKIKINQNITNQFNTGRCWLFSFTNILRNDLIRDYNLPENFNLSNTYLFFYDKLEKCNYFIDNVLDNLDKDFNSDLIKYLIKDPVTDGGNWHMAVNLINKYGILPEANMRESYQSTNSKYLNYFLKDNLLIYMNKIRKLYAKKGKKYFTKKQISKLKTEILCHIYKILCYFLGKPVSNFDWSYYDNNKKYELVKNLTPLTYYKKIMNFNPNEYVICVNYPVKEYPYDKIYNIKYCNNMINGKNTEMINLPINKLIKYCKKSIDDNEGIWFGSDVGKYMYNWKGILDTDIYNFENLYNTDMLTKNEALLYKQSEPSHAMVIIGYDKNKNNKITKWLVENSWGKKGDMDNEGYLRMSNNWFKKYVYSIVVKKKYMDPKIVKLFKNKGNFKDVEPWGYMGCAALE